MKKLCALLSVFVPSFQSSLCWILVTFTCFVSTQALSQGCSDAGFCTMGAMKPDQPYNKRLAVRLRSMEMSFYRGTTSLTPATP